MSRDGVLDRNRIDERLIESQVADRGCDVEFDEWLKEIRHPVTRFRLHLQPVVATWRSGGWEESETSQWVTIDDLVSKPLSVADRRVAIRVERIMRNDGTSM